MVGKGDYVHNMGHATCMSRTMNNMYNLVFM